MSLHIVVEGIDGSGKSTLVKGLSESIDTLFCGMDRRNQIAKFTEPSDGPHGRSFRELIRGEHSNEDALDLLLKDRAWLAESHIVPALESGKVVIQDRSFYSTFAYQGGESTSDLEKYRAGAPHPDILIFLDVDPSVAMTRIAARGGNRDVFEDRLRLMMIRENYRMALEMRDPKTYVFSLDGRISESSILNIAYKIVCHRCVDLQI